MSTTIEWAKNPDGTKGEVWNVVTGCTHSGMPGCDNCYARRLFPRVYGNDMVYEGKERSARRRFSDVMTHPDRLDKPLHWRKPRRVFVCSMGDLFHDDVPDEFIAAPFGVMAKAHWHTFQVLTKRPERMRAIITRLGGPPPGGTISRWIWAEAQRHPWPDWYRGNGGPSSWPSPHVWLGTSASTQADLERVVPDLLATPAAVRFLSLEPLLDEISVSGCTGRAAAKCHACGLKYGHDAVVGGTGCRGLDWIIVGCESGPKRRPCKLEWVRSVVEQCRAAGVSCFVKQLDLDGRVSKDPDEWPEDLRIRQMP